MKTLHILKTEPDSNTKTLIDILSKGEEATIFRLYEDQDCEKLIDLIFEHDKTISWWSQERAPRPGRVPFMSWFLTYHAFLLKLLIQVDTIPLILCIPQFMSNPESAFLTIYG